MIEYVNAETSNCGVCHNHTVGTASLAGEFNVYYLPCGHGIGVERWLTPEEINIALLMLER